MFLTYGIIIVVKYERALGKHGSRRRVLASERNIYSRVGVGVHYEAGVVVALQVKLGADWFLLDARIRSSPTTPLSRTDPTESMPRLNHKKTRYGCQRCKARKVKVSEMLSLIAVLPSGFAEHHQCDEVKPRCSACARHDVPCEYLAPLPRSGSHQQTVPAPIAAGVAPVVLAQEQHGDGRNLLELRLMHQWTAYTSRTFSPAWDFWQLQVPLMALVHPQVMDALMAMSALHLAKLSPADVGTFHTPSASDPPQELQHGDHGATLAQHLASLVPETHGPDAVQHQQQMTRVNYGMLVNSRIYFDRAMEGHRLSLSNELTLQNIEAIYTTTTMISFAALFSLSSREDDPSLPPLDPVLWVRSAADTRDLANRWQELAGADSITLSAVFSGKPDMSNEEELFQPQHAEPFATLLTWGLEYEPISEQDRDAYEKTVAYLGLTYKNILDGTDDYLATCRRIIALPARCPPRFAELAQERQSRAMAILTHMFALMKLIDSEAVWFRGIAEQQIPRFYERVGPAWQELLRWPMTVVAGEDGATLPVSEVKEV